VQREGADHVVQVDAEVRLGAEDEPARAGVETVGADEEVGRFGRAVAEDDLDAVSI
jgi:hypothetical protein